MTIRIVVAEDQRMVRELLAALLAREPDLEVVAEAGSGLQAIEAVEATKPDLLVLDIGLPDIDGIEVARRLRKRLPQLKLIALSVHADRRYVQEMFNAGAEGYVVKSSAVKELTAAIRTVMAGNIYLSSEIPREVLGGLPTSVHASALGAREREVLKLLAEGKRSAEIALELRISVATVEAHRRNIMRKLDLHSIAELTKYAVREGLSSL